MIDERRRLAILVVLTTVALAVALGLRPLSTGRILAGYVLVLAAVGLGAATRVLAASHSRESSRFEQMLSRRKSAATRPSELVRIEREITLGTSSAGNLHTRLLPLLREAAAARRGFDFELSPERARAALGDEAWELLRPARPAPTERSAPGLPLREVRALLDRLERL